VDSGKGSINQERDVIIFLEAEGARGDEINRGILTEGKRIATALGGGLRAVSVGVCAPEPRTLKEYGVSTLYAVEGEDFVEYDCAAFSCAALEALRPMPFRLLLFAHSDRGSELAPAIASVLGTSAVTDCVDIRIRDGKLVYVRHVYDDQFEQEVSYREGQREIAAMRIGALERREVMRRGPLEVWSITAEMPSAFVRTRTIEVLPPHSETVDIAYARRILGAGAGCRNARPLMEELARLLDASVGTTRVMVDEGYIPKSRMIGQTGKNVAPEKYMALGVSGSPHHVAGIQQSKEILCVNRDPAAPVFGFSDKGFVGDLNELLPKLIERIKRYRDEGLA
jgi:electron transfer flavoprotein alpha subunit